jgi:hypothetical protein
MKDLLYMAGQEWHNLTEEERMSYREESAQLQVQNTIPTPTLPHTHHISITTKPPIIRKALTPFQCFLKEQKAIIFKQSGKGVL